MKRARLKQTLQALGAKGVCEKRKTAACWYALGMRLVCAKLCDEGLSKMCEPSASETYAYGETHMSMYRNRRIHKYIDT